MNRQHLLGATGLFVACFVFAADVRAADYPRIVGALGELKEARREMNEAGVDFGGHKAKALKATDEAIEQLDRSLRAVGVDPKYVPPADDAYRRYKNYPRIRHAINELREGRRELKDARHDFKGHREKAVVAIDHAIEQLEKALEFKR